MPNLMLTNYCNKNCSYCFGVDIMAPKKKAVAMSRETFSDIVEWMERKPFDRVVHLMGGEPTLHPDVEWMIGQLLEHDMHLTIFSNMATSEAADLAEKLSDFPVKWVTNVGNPNEWTAGQRLNIERALRAAGQRASLSVNLLPGEVDDSWVLELIEKFDLCRNIKIGFVLPTLTSSNSSLGEEEYRGIAHRVTELVRAGESLNLSLGYECGIPYCCFTDEELGFLWSHNSMINSGCQSRLDITPEGEVIYCLPLSTAGRCHFSEFEDYPSCREWFENRYRPYRMLGSKVECADCMLNNPLKCNGGCLAKNMIGAHNVEFSSVEE